MTLMLRAALLLLVLNFLGPSSFAQTIRYVKVGGAGTQDGLSWGNAAADLQEMINNSAANDQVWVMAGTYQRANGSYFSMKEGVKIYGGFLGSETSLGQRNWKVNKTVLKGNNHSVVYNYGNGLTTAALLDGFTVTGGIHRNGAGIYNDGSSPSIINCTISGNTANVISNGWGGGMLNSDSSPLVVNCVFSGNTATGPGGGMANSGSSLPTIINCLFIGNTASFGGGLASAYGASTMVINSTFSGNRASYGGGVYNNSFITLKNCIVYGNESGFFNGTGSSADISNSLVQDWIGGGVGNISGTTDPLFLDMSSYTTAPFTGGNYRLQLGSPCINMGSNVALPTGTATDILGAERIQGLAVDMGAYEYNSNSKALHFDGINDVVSIPASTNFDLPVLTIEAWVKPESFSGSQTIVASRNLSQTRFSILQNAMGITLWNGNNTATVNWTKLPVLNRWYHLVVVLKVGTADIYMNGQLMGSTNIGVGNATNLPFLIGGGAPNAVHEQFKGTIDEIRIWQGERSATEIANNYDKPILSSTAQPNLLAYFEFAEGAIGAGNSAIAALVNRGTALLTASLNNFARNGTSSNWVESYAMVMPLDLTVENIALHEFMLKWNMPDIGTVEQFEIEVATDDQFTQPIVGSPFMVAGAATSKVINGLTSGTVYYTRVRAEKASVTGQGTYSPVKNVTTLIPAPGTALNFDGTNDYVSLGNSSILKPVDQLSVGVWVNRADWNVNTLQAMVSNTQSGGYSINIGDVGTAASGKYITALVYRNGGYARPTFDASKLTPGWHYIALTYNGQLTKLYVDGIEVASNDVGSVKQISYHALNSTLVGAEGDDLDVPAPEARYFKGSLDELRIYNTALTTAEIQADMQSETSVKTANLIAHYNFDRVVPSNSTELTDGGTNAKNGILRNFSFTGASSNWVESYAMVVPKADNASDVAGTKFTANWLAPSIGIVDNGYLLDVATNTDFTSPIVGSPFTVNAFTKEVTGLTDGTNYYYRVRADKTSVTGQGAPSETIVVKTLAGPQPNTENILYVDINATGEGNGSSWANAVPQLADALKWARTKYNADNAVFDTTPLKIYVAKGTYKPLYHAADGSYTTNGNRDNTFVMVKNVQLYGGFDPANHITALSHTRVYGSGGSILSGDIGTPGANTDNTYHVVISSGDVETALLNGFTVTGGNEAQAGSITVNGNEMYKFYGGGMYSKSSSPDIINCIFTANTANYGGGMANEDSSPAITNCIFAANTAYFAGGLLNLYSSSTINNCIFTGNTAIVVEGGAIINSGETLTITNSTFANNGSEGFRNNSPGTAILQNCIIWDTVTGTYTAKNSLIKGASSTVNGNIDASALLGTDIFKDPTNGDYTLKSSSPAIAKGSNALFTGLDAATLDLAGNPRVYNYATGGAIDLGAYEYQGGLSQTISFAALDPKTTASTDYALSATASSGLVVSYTSSNTAVAEVYQDASVWKVKIKGEGNTDITASQTGDGNYSAATVVVQQLMVTGGPLPVELISYTAKVEGNYAKLQWQTTNEVNNKQFIVYRSGDDKQFVKIGEVSANINHQPLSINHYNYLDKQPLNGNNYYKLLQVDRDGKANDLGERTLNFQLSTLNFQLYPNPTTSKVVGRFGVGKFTSATLTGIDGKVLKTVQLTDLQQELEIDLSAYPVGMYFMRLIGTDESVVKKVIKQ